MLSLALLLKLTYSQRYTCVHNISSSVYTSDSGIKLPNCWHRCLPNSNVQIFTMTKLIYSNICIVLYLWNMLFLDIFASLMQIQKPDIFFPFFVPSLPSNIFPLICPFQIFYFISFFLFSVVAAGISCKHSTNIVQHYCRPQEITGQSFKPCQYSLMTSESLNLGVSTTAKNSNRETVKESGLPLPPTEIQ